MKRFVSFAVVLLTLFISYLSDSARAQSKAKGTRRVPLAELLAGPIPGGFPGVEEDPKITLREVLDLMGERLEVHFNVNEEAFRQEGVKNALDAKVALLSLPAMGTCSLGEVLKKVLSRVRGTSLGATYLVRPDYIEITTVAAMRAEVWGSDFHGPFLPLVNRNFDRLPLRAALEALEEQTGYSIVLDARVDEQGDKPVTARLRNIPLDTAVRLLADMAGLRVALNDNALYVSTEARVMRLRPGPDDSKVVAPRLRPEAPPATMPPVLAERRGELALSDKERP